jgi:hypothetical protein
LPPLVPVRPRLALLLLVRVQLPVRVPVLLAVPLALVTVLAAVNSWRQAHVPQALPALLSVLVSV